VRSAARISVPMKAVVRTRCAHFSLSLRLCVLLGAGGRCLNIRTLWEEVTVNLVAKNTATVSGAMAEAISAGTGSRYG